MDETAARSLLEHVPMGKSFTVRVVSCFAGMVFAAGTARAQSSRAAPSIPSADAVEEDSRRESTWYGWQTLATDGAAIALVAIGVENGAGDIFSQNRTAEAVATAGLGTYLIGAPVVHLAHRRPGVALGSLGLRIGAPFLGYMAASTLEGCVGSDNANSCGSNAEAVGMLFGIGTAMALDAAFLARKSDQRERSPRISSAPRPRLSPGIAVTGQSRALVLAGSF